MKYLMWILALLIALLNVSCEEGENGFENGKEKEEDWDNSSNWKYDDSLDETKWFHVHGIDSITFTTRSYPYDLEYCRYKKEDGIYIYKDGQSYASALMKRNKIKKENYYFTMWHYSYKDDDGKTILVGYRQIYATLKNGKLEVENLFGYTNVEFDRMGTFKNEESSKTQLKGEWAISLTKDSIILVFEDKLKEYIYQKGTNNVLLYTEYGIYDLMKQTVNEGGTISENYRISLPKSEVWERARFTLNGDSLHMGSGINHLTAGTYTKIK